MLATSDEIISVGLPAHICSRNGTCLTMH